MQLLPEAALLGTARKRDAFLRILSEVRERYQFWLIGYVVMPEHIHLLISEPKVGTPSTVMQVLKQRVSQCLRRKNGGANKNQIAIVEEAPRRRCEVSGSGGFMISSVEREEEDREAELHAQESGEARIGRGAGVVGVEQLSVLSVWGEECMHARSGAELGV